MLESALLAVELALVAALLIANLAAYLRSGRWINLVVAVLLVLGVGLSRLPTMIEAARPPLTHITRPTPCLQGRLGLGALALRRVAPKQEQHKDPEVHRDPTCQRHNNPTKHTHRPAPSSPLPQNIWAPLRAGKGLREERMMDCSGFVCMAVNDGYETFTWYRYQMTLRNPARGFHASKPKCRGT